MPWIFGSAINQQKNQNPIPNNYGSPTVPYRPKGKAPGPSNTMSSDPRVNNVGSYIFSSFSGADIVATITVPILLDDPNTINKTGSNGYKTAMAPVVIGNIQTLTVSTHREKFPVRALKSVNPRGYTRGPRFIGGTIIFSMFDRESLREVQDKVLAYMQQASWAYSFNVGNVNLSDSVARFLSDELPPFDIVVTMANEYGSAAKIMITGVEILSWGNVMGVDDLFIEETMTYQARGIVPLHPDPITTNPAPKVK